MTSFTDGPARGVTLELRRAPLFLRVVRGPDSWDALDQVDDVPLSEEQIHVYRRIGRPAAVHIDYRDKQGRRRGQWSQTVEYRLYEVQPHESCLRDNSAWQAWALAEGRTVTALREAGAR